MEGWKKKLLIGVIIADALAVNTATAYLLYRQENSNNLTGKNSLIPGGNQLPEDQTGCGEDCQKQFYDQIALIRTEVQGLSEAGRSGTIAPAPSVKPTTKPLPAPTRVKVRQVQYVTIPGSGSTQANSWTDLSGTDFYFNPGDYPGLVEVYLEANMKLFNGNGMAYIRLLDVTHGIGVQGSDVKTALQTDSVATSGKVSFWAGKNLIRVQAMSLTADTAVYSSGRLRIVTEN